MARVLARLPNRRAPTVSVLDPDSYRLLLVEAPDVPADELRAAVRWRVKDLIDFHVDDAVIDVFEMPQHARGGRRRRRLGEREVRAGRAREAGQVAAVVERAVHAEVGVAEAS